MFTRLTRSSSSFFKEQYKSIKPHMKPAFVTAFAIEAGKKGIEMVLEDFDKEKTNENKYQR
jgi:hypothetical protein